jgi:hypothetical protein
MSETRATGRDELDTALEAEIAAWMERVAPAHAPAGLFEAALARTRSIPAPRPWRRSLDQLVGAVPAPMRLALTALVIIALAAGAVGVGSRLLPNPNPAPNPPVVPALIRAGVVEPSGGLTLADVVASGAGLIATELRPQGLEPGGAKAWTSSDGVTWTSVPADGAVPVLTGIGGSRTALRAIGLLCPSGSTTPTVGCSLAVGSLAAGGWDWQKVRWTAPQDGVGTPLFGPGPGLAGYGFEVNAAIAGGPGYVMVGWAVRIDGTQIGQPVGPAVATSTDGVAWTFRVLFDPVTSPLPLGTSSMSSVAARGQTIIAVGSGTSVEPAVWVSTGGSSWDRVAAPGAPSHGELDWVAASPAGFVAVGRDGANAAAWVSSDGRKWHAAPPSAALEDAWMTRVTWTGGEFLAVGKTAGGDGAAWVSTDGLTWDRLDTTAIFKSSPVVAGAALGSRLVLVGQDPAGQGVVAISAR